jgi:mRNA interferase YafQ
MTLLIQNDGPLPPEWSDHALKGEWEGYRECHAGGDLLLVYQLPDEDSVIFVRAGSHAELFE